MHASRIIQTNAAGDNIHLIDPATNKVVGIINDIEVPHGVPSAPDGKHVVSGSIPGRMITVIDQATEEIAFELPMSAGIRPMESAGIRPMEFEKAPDGSTARIFVQLSDYHGIAVVVYSATGGDNAVSVVDTATLKEVARIPVGQVPKRNGTALLRR